MKIIILTLIVAAVAYGFFKEYQTQHDSRRASFQAGRLPDPLPSGPYQGIVAGNAGDWRGKNFKPSEQTGDNLFQQGSQVIEKYPFETSVGQSLSEKNLQVYKIDYNRPHNPLWLRLVVDEIVETKPDHYIGKIHLRLLPGLSLAVGWFELKR